jgi:hypothetical protein
MGGIRYVHHIRTRYQTDEVTEYRQPAESGIEHPDWTVLIH